MKKPAKPSALPASGRLRLGDALRLIVIRESSINPAASSYDDMTKSVPPSTAAIMNERNE